MFLKKKEKRKSDNQYYKLPEHEKDGCMQNKLF